MIRARFALGLLALLGLGCAEREPDLDILPQLLAARRFDEAERRLAAQVRLHPRDDRARVLLAQVSLNRPDQKPAVALEALAQVRLRDPKALAVVRLYQGKAFSNLHDDEAAEGAWLDALRLDPQVPEAGWALLGLYYVQGRPAAARSLALRLHATEPDPRDRARLLLELIRQDAMPLEPGSVAAALGPVVQAHPEALHPALALGRALVRASQAERGLLILRDAVARHPHDPEAWDGLLEGLDDAGALDELAATLAKLPAPLAEDARFARHAARLAQEKHDWPAAADSYLRSLQAGAGGPELAFRLGRALRLAGRTAEAVPFQRIARSSEAARSTLLDLYKGADARKDLGVAGRTENVPLYQRLAEARESTGRPEEALAWHRLALRDRPDDPVSKAALARLQAAQSVTAPPPQPAHPRQGPQAVRKPG